jgi:hypothetical protein
LRHPWITPTIVAVFSLSAAGSANAGTTCADLDGDGTAETCIETKDTDDDGQDDEANIPGQPPPETPDPGEGTPSEPEPDDEEPPEDDSDDDPPEDDEGDDE